MTIIFQTKLAPYRIPFYRALAQKINFLVVYTEFENMNARDILGLERLFLRVELKKFKVFGREFTWIPISSVISLYKPKNVVFELSNYNLTLIGQLITKWFRNYKIIGWGHGYYRMDKSGVRNLPRIMKKLISIGCDSIITYTPGGKEFLTNLGVNEKKISIAWNAVLIEKTALFERNQNKYQLKKLLFIGRLIPEKRPGLVCEILEYLNRKEDRYYLDVVGSGPMADQLIQKYGQNANIKFLGSIIDDDILGSLLMSSSALVNPGYLGLNIVHGISFGLPIISVRDGIGGIHHSPEYEYISGEKCFVGVSVLNVESFCKKIENLFSEEKLYQECSENAFKIAKEISIERMVEGYLSAL